MAETETPAEVMRRAAGLMRERAEAANPGPWAWEATGEKDNSWAVGLVQDEAGDSLTGELKDSEGIVIDGVCESINGRLSDAAHIASWHPLVAAAVADLLEEIARQYDAPPCDYPDGVCNGCERREDFNDAVRLARAYLGEAAA